MAQVSVKNFGSSSPNISKAEEQDIPFIEQIRNKIILAIKTIDTKTIITVSITYRDGGEVFIKCDRAIPVKRTLEAACGKWGLDPSQYQLIINNKYIANEEWPNVVLENGATLQHK